MSIITNEQALTAYAAKEKAGSIRGGAKLLDMPRTTFKGWLAKVSERNLDDHIEGFVIPDGFGIKSEGRVFDKNGELSGFTVKTGKESGDEFAMPDGHEFHAGTAQVGPDGLVERQWIKHKQGHSIQETSEIIKAAFNDFKPVASKIPKPINQNKQLLTVYPFCDWHLGLFAWGKETGGDDWDLSIARKVILETTAELIECSPQSENAVILGLGDLLHADNEKNVTARSGNALDVDTRHAKCLGTLCDILVEASEMVAAKHQNVEMTFRPGNHDENSTVGITQAMRMYWRQSNRVNVDDTPDHFYWKRFGCNLIGGSHGDKAKIKQIPMTMANRCAKDWGDTTSRHHHTGHIHHHTVLEDGGVTVFSHRAPTAQDAYHAANGYVSGRSMKSFTYHETKGHRGTVEIEIK